MSIQITRTSATGALTWQLLPAGVFRPLRLAGGGGGGRTKQMVEDKTDERRGIRKLDETILKHPLNFRNEVMSGQGKSKVKIRAFRIWATLREKFTLFWGVIESCLKRLPITPPSYSLSLSPKTLHHTLYYSP